MPVEVGEVADAAAVLRPEGKYRYGGAGEAWPPQVEGRLGVFHGPGLMGGDVAGQLQDTVVPVLPDGAAVSGIALDELEFQPPAQFLRGEVDCPAGAVHRGHLHCPGGIPSSQYGGVSADGQDAVLLYCRSRHPDDDLAGVEVGLGGLAVRVGEEYLGEGGGEEGSLSRIALPLVVEEELPGRAVQAQDPFRAGLVEGGAVL